MAYLYNAGTTREFTFTQCAMSSCGIDMGNRFDIARGFYLMETPVPYDVIPLVREFLNDTSRVKNVFFKSKVSLNWGFGIKISGSSSSCTLQWGQFSGGNMNTFTSKFTIGTFSASSLPEHSYIYMLWCHNPSTVNEVQFIATIDPHRYYACEAIENPYHNPSYPNTAIAIKGIENTQTSYDLTDFNTYSEERTIPYDKTQITFPVDGVLFYPNQLIKNGDIEGGSWGNFNGEVGNTIVGAMSNYDGTEPTPIVPPTPPTPGDDPNDEGDPSGPDGGDGDHTPDYDPVPVPDVPSDGVADAGFITLYKMTFRDFDEFASKCFADNIWEAAALKFKNPTDFLVGALLLPFIPHTGISYYPKFGTKTLDTAYPRIDEQFFDVDCGSITIDKYWGSCFDYEPYTKIQIWLPYIGYKDLPVDEFMGNTVSVKYRCDCLTGDCIAFVYIGVVGQTGPQVERIIGQYYGNCGVRVPFGSASFDAAIAAGITLIGAAAASGLVAAGAAAVGAESGAGVLLASGEAAGKAVTGTAGRAASIGVVQGMKPNVQHGGAAGASGGYMGVQKPYIIRRIPRQNLPENFMNLKGYPSNIGGKLADFTGLAIVDEIQLNDIPAMEDERSEIIEWLRGGVLL